LVWLHVLSAEIHISSAEKKTRTVGASLLFRASPSKSVDHVQRIALSEDALDAGADETLNVGNDLR